MRPPRPWHGSVIARAGYLYLQVKDEGGGWRQRAPFPGEPLADTPANRERAERALAELRALLVAQEEARGGEAGPLTVERWAKTWLRDRRALVQDADNDATRLRLHVYPVIGHMRLDEVRPRHVDDVVQRLKIAGKGASGRSCARSSAAPGRRSCPPPRRQRS
jgi:hypothetical protein